MIGLAGGAAILAGVAFGVWGIVAFAASVLALCAVSQTVPSGVAITLVALLALVGVWRHAEPGLYPAFTTGRMPDLDALTVTDAPDLGSEYQQFVAASADDHDARICIVARALPVVGVGDRIAVTGSPRHLRDEALGSQRFLASHGCGASLFARSLRVTETASSTASSFGRLRAVMSERLRQLVPGDSGALLAGLVVGDDSALSRQRATAFTNAGATHLTAVSGSNLALIAGMLVALGRASVGQHRLVWQLVTIAGVWAFALVSGAEAPAVRAAIVATIALLAIRFGRAADFPTLIMLAAGLMALIDPGQVSRLGFQLSVAASLALAIALPALSLHGATGMVSSVMLATVVAQIATFPLLLAVFGSVAALSVPANMLVVPLAGVAMPLAGIAGVLGLVNRHLGELAVVPAASAADFMIGIVDWLGSSDALVAVGMPPLASSFVLAGTCAALVMILAGKRRS